MRSLLFSLLFIAVSSKGQPLQADSIVSMVSLKETVLFLSGDSLKGRLTGSRGADIAAAYIGAKFNSMGLKPLTGSQGYFDSFPVDYNRKKMPAKNVMGTLAGKFANDSVVIFSAHYDHIGEKDNLPFNKDFNYQDDIFNGANDNATGVAALLEIAKYYIAQNNNRYQVLFVAFAGEEMGMLGSSYLMNKSNPTIIKAVINLEMLGRPDADNCFILTFRNNTVRNLLNKQLKIYQPDSANKFYKTDPYPDERLASRSDHYPFAGKVKNAFTIMGTSPTDTYYHTVDDEYETIDFDFLLKATMNIAIACEQFTRQP